jgi:D-3-phosphoglycerate dehydrogenase
MLFGFSTLGSSVDRAGFAAVDAFEEAPVLGARHPLLQLSNALCTQHLGYVETDNDERYFGLAFDSINRFASGQATDSDRRDNIQRA